MADDVHKTKYYCMHNAWPTQSLIPTGSVNENQLPADGKEKAGMVHSVRG